MSDTGDKPLKGRYELWWQAGLGLTAVVLTGALIYYFLFYYAQGIGVEQPIPFSHRVHVNNKKISCFLCHPEAMSTARAGIPPVETCMLCHSRVVINYPPISRVRAHYFERKPILWEKIYTLPDFVYFEHSLHINRRIDCSHCHGNVALMDRIVMQQPFTMGFCIGCHRQTKATHDCFTCHR